MATKIWVNIGSGNGLLPDGTKPLPEPMLTYHQSGPVAFTWGQFPMKCSIYLFLIRVWKSLIWGNSHISQGPMSWDVLRLFDDFKCSGKWPWWFVNKAYSMIATDQGNDLGNLWIKFIWQYYVWYNFGYFYVCHRNCDLGMSTRNVMLWYSS